LIGWLEFNGKVRGRGTGGWEGKDKFAWPWLKGGLAMASKMRGLDLDLEHLVLEHIDFQCTIRFFDI